MKQLHLDADETARRAYVHELIATGFLSYKHQDSENYFNGN